MNQGRKLRRQNEKKARLASGPGQSGPLPDFALAEPRPFDPALLRSKHEEDRRIDAFLLSLALVFNDLKDFLWFYGATRPGASYYPEGVVNAGRGQMSGMTLRAFRSIAVVLHELLENVDKHKKMLDSELNDSARSQWFELRASAAGTSGGGSGPKDPVAKMLKTVRDKTGTHYDIEKLQRGYEEHFRGDASEPQRQAAYYSRGGNMEGTRFYFADAAAEGLFQAELGITRKEFEEDLRKKIGSVNNTLKWLLDAWILIRTGSATGNFPQARAEAHVLTKP